MELQELQNRLFIDKNRLDWEIIHQAHLYNDIGIATVEAKSRADALNESYKNTDATLNGTIREELTAAGGKFTEAVITAKVQTHPDHVKAYQDYLDAKLEADKLSILKDSFGQRSSMLRDLVSLYNSEYFTKDSISVTNNTDVAVELKKSALTANRSEVSSSTSTRRIVRKQKENE